jgi:hypothetical protein
LTEKVFAADETLPPVAFTGGAGTGLKGWAAAERLAGGPSAMALVIVSPWKNPSM